MQIREPLTRTLPLAVWIALAACTLFVWFAALDTRTLQNPDEGRYAEIPREMVITGDYLTPRLNGLKYFEKPPLQYWATALAYKAFEIDEWTARLAAASGALMAAIVVGITLGVLATPLAGVYGFVVMLSCVLSVGLGHFNTLDAFLTGWLALVLGAFLRAQRPGIPRRNERNWMLLAYAAAGAATLTKGPVAIVIPAASLVLYTLATRDVSPWKRLHLGWGLVVYLVVTAPWFVLASRANPEFADFFFFHENVDRFLTTEHRRTGAWWYFVPIFGFGLLPWLFIWVATFFRSWRQSAPLANGFDWMRFCWVWSLFVFVFFSLSGSKLPSYIYPEYPAIAMLLGFELHRASRRLLWWTTAIHTAGAAGFLLFMLFGYAALIPHLASQDTPAALFVAFGKPLTLAGVVFVAGSLGALWFFRSDDDRSRTLGILSLAMCGLVGFQLAFIGHEAFRSVRSGYELVRDAQNQPGGAFDRNAPVFQVGTYDQTFPYYLRKTTTIVEFRDELALGLDAEPEKAYATIRLWIPAWKALPQGYALMQRETYEYLLKLGVPMRVIASDPRRRLVARR
ncbi:MAG: glycosyltransferase family 39 protein [Proteobacteria bacterium]|nr:glycosyltransferase family 39 protein [Pseudomonadota bacterium]